MITEKHREILGQFFHSNISGREQREGGSGVAWLTDFWFCSTEEQNHEIAAWAEAQQQSLRAGVDQHIAALADLVAHANGNERAKTKSA